MTLGSALIGLWLYVSVIYQGKEMPLPNPTLQLQMIFVNSTQMKLRYSYLGESGFCESAANYVYDSLKKNLHLEVVEVHPDNAEFCQQDPDMRLGRKSETPVILKEGRLHFRLGLGEEELTMILIRQ